MNKVLNIICEAGIKIIFAFCLIFTMHGCKENRFTQQELDAFLIANQNQYLEVSQKIKPGVPPASPHWASLSTIYHVIASGGSKLFFEISTVIDSYYYEVDDPKYGNLFIKLTSENKITSNVIGYISEFNLLTISNSEICFSNDDYNFSLKKVTDNHILKSLKNAPKVDLDYLIAEYDNMPLP